MFPTVSFSFELVIIACALVCYIASLQNLFAQVCLHKCILMSFIAALLKKKKSNNILLEKWIIQKRKFQLCEFFPSVVWPFFICHHEVHHCLSHFIFLGKYPHTVFDSLSFMQNWFFPFVLGKWRSALMKGSCYCWSRPEQSSELSQIWAHRPCWVRERVSAGRLHLYTINPCTAIYPTFSCRWPRYFPVTSVWGTADRWWWVTQIHSAWGSSPATLPHSLPRLCCLPQASSCAIPFLFHRFFQLLKLEVGVLF